jgi:hypothetical protein
MIALMLYEREELLTGFVNILGLWETIRGPHACAREVTPSGKGRVEEDQSSL